MNGLLARRTPLAIVLFAFLAGACSSASDGTSGGGAPSDRAGGDGTSDGKGADGDPNDPTKPGGGSPGGGEPTKPPVAPGAVDPSYGSAGTLEMKSPTVAVVAFSPSGRFAAAPSKNNRYIDLHVFDANGGVDAASSVKTSPIMIADADDHSQALGFAMELSDDGSAIVYGSMRRSGAPYPFVARIKNGALDPTFGVNGVRRIETYYAYVGALRAIRNASGAITGYYVGVSASAVGNLSPVGERAAEYRIHKMSTAGALDATFGSGGSVKVDGGLLSVDATGRFTTARAYNPASPTANFDYTQYITQRYTTAGALDTTYGTGGSITATIPKSRVNDVLVLKNGEMLLALGVAGATPSDFVTRIARFSPTGAATDVSPGKRYVDLTAPYAMLSSELPDGKIVVDGYVQSDHGYVERRMADFTLDPAFGKSGVFAAAAPEFVRISSPATSGSLMVATSIRTSSSDSETIRVRRLGK